MRHIAYYISGNGYGHAVRSIEIIKALLAKNPYLFFHIRTTVPSWFFSLNLKDSYYYAQCEIDVGTVQHDFTEVDKQATLERVRNLFARKSEIVAEEVQFCQKNRIELIIGDIPPLAFAIAEAAGLPSVAVGNFSWDWIYESYAEELPAFDEIITKIRVHYRQADLLLRLPMHGTMDAFRTIIDIPLVARKAMRKSRDVRRMLRIEDDDRYLVLVALRPADVRLIDFSALCKNRKLNLMVINQEQPIPGVMNLPQGLIPFQELVKAADVVVSKPGYGIVSECMVNRTPLLYTERKDFREYDRLVRAIRQNDCGYFISLKAFLAGEWQAAIEHLVNLARWQVEASNRGAKIAAERILQQIGDGAFSADVGKRVVAHF